MRPALIIYLVKNLLKFFYEKSRNISIEGEKSINENKITTLTFTPNVYFVNMKVIFQKI